MQRHQYTNDTSVLSIYHITSQLTQGLVRLLATTYSNKMLQGAHVFSHQAFGHNDPSWMQGHHQTHHAQQAAAQAATSMAHAQHYNRINANHNSGPSHSSNHGQESNMMDGVTEENRRVLGWIADLLNEETRESALLELSKKREQVPELALILWHSFGKSCSNYSCGISY